LLDGLDHGGRGGDAIEEAELIKRDGEDLLHDEVDALEVAAGVVLDEVLEEQKIFDDAKGDVLGEGEVARVNRGRGGFVFLERSCRPMRQALGVEFAEGMVAGFGHVGARYGVSGREGQDARCASAGACADESALAARTVRSL
jgi:hypothetical protein